MPNLVIRRNEIDYTAALAEPAFELWGEAKTLVSGLYKAFRPFGVSLSDISDASDGESLAEKGVRVSLGPRGSFTFRFDRLEANLSNFLEPEIEQFARFAEAGYSWLRESVPAASATTHFIGYSSHSSLSEGRSSDVLQRINPIRVEGIGESRGHGLSLHFDIPDRGWVLRLSIDHSLAVEDGIYLHLFVTIRADRIDYIEVMHAVRGYLDRILNEFGLRFGEEG
jgi:hypothetical protein